MTGRPGYGVRLRSAERLLRDSHPSATKEVRWPGGPIRISAYLGAAALPTEIPGRARVVVTRDDLVLVAWDRTGHPDCFPGGGIEAGETPRAAARREVWEETGWHLDPASIEEIGWLHIYSIGGRPEEHTYPHPDLFMPVFAGHPSLTDSPPTDWHDTEGFVARSALVPRPELPPEIQRDPISQAFLRLIFQG